MLYHTRHPLLLPKNHYVTELIIQNAHFQTKHEGLQETMCKIREDFFDPKGKAEDQDNTKIMLQM